MKIFVAVYVLAFVILALLGRALWVGRRIGYNPFLIDRGAYGIKALMSRIYGLLSLMLASLVLLFLCSDRLYGYLQPIACLQGTGWQLAGAALLVLSLAGIVVAQAQMGTAWRMGIDHRPTHLVDQGLYRYSRNPIYVAVQIGLLGLFLALPNLLSWTCFTLGVTLIHIQVCLEEEHLRGLHGERFEEFAQRVRRWV